MMDGMGTASADALATEGGEVLDVFGGMMIVKADPALHSVSVGEHRVPPGYLVPPHRHGWDAEVLFVLEGDLTLLLPDGERVMGPGATARLPAGSLHGFRNAGETVVRFLVVANPGLQGLEMFRHIDRIGRSSPAGRAPSEIVAICAQYGVTMG